MKIQEIERQHYNGIAYGDISKVLKEFGKYIIEETLKEAAEKVLIEQLYNNTNKWKADYRRFNALETFIQPKKESILNLQKQLEEKLL